MTPRTVFIHGRPGPHPFHAALARSVKADFLPVDFLLHWQDRVSSRPRRYLSWLLCGLFFPQQRQYDVFLTEGLHFPPLVMKRLGLLKRHQRVVGLLANETLYFLKAGRYSKRTCRALLAALNTYDALLCVGRMQTELAQHLLCHTPGKPPLLLRIPSGFSALRRDALHHVEPCLDGLQLLFIGDGTSDWRGWYKGLDLLLQATRIATSQLDGLRLKIVGEWDGDYAADLLSACPAAPADVQFIGHLPHVGPMLSDSALYVHLGRGEAFGLSILEAMCAGVPALVSEWTGAREAVEQVDSRLIVPLNAQVAAERICWYMRLTLPQKKRLSTRSREVAAMYTEERAVQEFRAVFSQFAS